MDIPEQYKEPVKNYWEINDARHGMKMMITHAVSNVSDITVKQLDEIFAELDRILLKENEPEENQKNRGL